MKNRQTRSGQSPAGVPAPNDASKNRGALSLSLWSALTVVSLLISCAAPRAINVIPTDRVVSESDRVQILSGTGVQFVKIDGQPVRASGLIAAPGKHDLIFEVRKRLRAVNEMLDGVSHFGTCRIPLDAAPGAQYRFSAVTATAWETLRGEANTGVGAMHGSFSTVVVFEDLDTGEVSQVPCQLLLDCRRLKDGVSRSSQCHDFR